MVKILGISAPVMVVIALLVAFVAHLLSMIIEQHNHEDMQKLPLAAPAQAAQVMSPAQQQDLQQQQRAFYGSGSASIPSTGKWSIHPG